MSLSLEEYKARFHSGEANEATAKAPEEIEIWAGHRFEANHGSIGRFFLRRFGPFPVGFVHRGGRHYIDHITHIESGALLVHERGENESWRIIEAPNFVNIAAGNLHNFIVVAEQTRWYCIFAEKHVEELDPTPERPYHLRRG